MSCCLIFLLLGAIALYSCECASIQSSVTYVLGENGESQLSACSRVGMYPTAISALIDWSYGVFLNVSTDFGMEPLDPSGISGCCVGGMWCNGTVCFTQSFSSSFQNYGALSFLPGGTSTFQPVYSCDGGSFCENGLDMTGGACNTTVPASSVSLSSATLENTYPEPSSGMVGEIVGVTMLLQGTNFGTDQSAVGVSLAGSSGDSSGSAPITPYCSYLELCTDLCGTCNTGVDCPNGAACISPSQGAQGHCFPYCAGPTDDSCPCGSSCLSVVVGSTMDSGQNVGVQVNLCTPDSSFACNTGIYGRGTEAAMCTIAGGNYVAASGQNVSIIVGGEGDSEGGSVTMLTNSVSSTNGFEVLSVDTELESSADPESELMQVHAHGKLRGAVMDGSRNDMIVDVHVQQTSVARRLNAQCSTDSDCNDGDRCTINACVDSVCTVLLNNSINGAADCVSSLPALQQKSAPFTYINAQFSNASPRQAAFMSFMLQNGQVATDRGGSSIYLTVADSNSDSTIPLSSLTEFQYFGNKVTEIGVAPMGVVTLTPVPYCDSRVREILCVKYGSASNTISLWNHNWVYETDSQVLVYVDTTPDNSSVPAVHVLYYNAYLDENVAPGMGNNFSLSLYADGSVRLSYINIQYDDMAFSAPYQTNHPEMFSLFSARAGNSSSFPGLKYHQELVPFPLSSLFPVNGSSSDARGTSAGGLDVVYCYMPYTLGCVTNSCVSPTAAAEGGATAGAQMVMQLQSNAASSEDLKSRNAATARLNSCAALGEDTELVYSCVWITGDVTAATLNTTSFNSTADSVSGSIVSVVTLSCDVPTLPFPDGTLVSVTITAGLSSAHTANITTDAGTMVTDLRDGIHSLFTVTRGGVNGSETASSEIMLRYYSANTTASTSCGCNAMQGPEDTAVYQCSACNVCGATSTSAITDTTLDCAGSCFGSAYVDSCAACSGGLSDVSPDMYCAFAYHASSSTNNNSVVSIILFVLLCSALVMCCCVMKIFTRNSAMERHGLARRQNQLNDMINLELTRGGIIDDDFFDMLGSGRFGQLQRHRERANVPAAAPGLTRAEIKSLSSFIYPSGGASGEGGASGGVGAASEDITKPGSKELVTEVGTEGGIELGVLTAAAATGINTDADADAETETEADAEVMDKEGMTLSGKSVSPAPGEDGDCCSICLDSFKPGDSCRKLPDPCGHTFHESCIDLWLEMKTNCPLCKRSIKDILPSGPISDEPDQEQDYARRVRTAGAVEAYRQIQLVRAINGRVGRGTGVIRVISPDRRQQQGLGPGQGYGQTQSARARAFMADHDQYQDLPTIPVRSSNINAYNGQAAFDWSPFGSRVHHRRPMPVPTHSEAEDDMFAASSNSRSNLIANATDSSDISVSPSRQARRTMRQQLELERERARQSEMDDDFELQLALATSMSLAESEQQANVNANANANTSSSSSDASANSSSANAESGASV